MEPSGARPDLRRRPRAREPGGPASRPALGVVVDTSALVELERAGPGWEGRLSDALADEEAVLPTIVYAELLTGVQLADTASRAAARQARVDGLVARFPLVALTPPIAVRWALLFAALRRSGRTIPSNDLTVAATAVELGFAVAVGSADEAHFRQVPDLDVRSAFSR